MFMPTQVQYCRVASVCLDVISRGNDRADVFKAVGAKAAFAACLFQACAECRNPPCQRLIEIVST
jgi:hypothetical protein